VARARTLLQKSEEALDRGDLDSGWRLFRGARRLAILGYPPSRLDAEARALGRLAEDLPEHRREAIQEFLRKAPTVENLSRATLQRDEYYDDMYHGIGLQYAQISVILAINTVVLLAFPVMALVGLFDPTSALDTSDAPQLVAVILAGMLGASLSALTWLMHVNRKAEIYERLVIMRVTFLRSVLGGAAALALLFLLESGLLAARPSTLGGMLAIAFAGGFTERLVVKAVATVADRAARKAKA
jgi:hypothetical protein